MPVNPKIAEFIEKALTAGIPQDSLVGVLTARGWPEKEVYDALADHYERLAGVDVPRRAGSGASAKEAFFYLLIFGTLATWSICFWFLASTLIDRWLADPLFSAYQRAYGFQEIPSWLAAVIVAFPLYLLLSRAVIKEGAAHPEKLDSAIRKWLTYMALVIAAGIFMGDLITALAYLLRGELTSRFLAKSIIVLVLSGGVFYYYFGGLRKTGTSANRLNRDRLMALISSAAVVLMVVLGFSQSGPPSTQREFRADSQRLRHLYQFSSEIRGYWTTHLSQLPPSLDQLPSHALRDPITRAPYEYRPKQGSKYELCAVFTQNSRSELGADPEDLWTHPAGHYCFPMDASANPQYPPQYFGN